MYIQGQQVRRLRQFQYLEWPDIGSVPDEQNLITYIEVVRDQIPPRGGPIVVHCRSVAVAVGIPTLMAVWFIVIFRACHVWTMILNLLNF